MMVLKLPAKQSALLLAANSKSSLMLKLQHRLLYFSLPSVSRPQNLKLPQSHSLNAFPSKATTASNTVGGSEAAQQPPDDLNRLIFFFNVMSTQEKIAKVQLSY